MPHDRNTARLGTQSDPDGKRALAAPPSSNGAGPNTPRSRFVYLALMPPWRIWCLVAVAWGGCAIPLQGLRVDPPIEGHAADGDRAVAAASLTRLAVSSDIFLVGPSERSHLAVQIDLRNPGTHPLQVRPAEARLQVQRDAQEPGSATLLSAIAGGPGDLPAAVRPAPPKATIVIPAGESRRLWLSFSGLPQDGSDGKARFALHLAIDGQKPIELILADPGRGRPQWQVDDRAPFGAALQTGVGAYALPHGHGAMTVELIGAAFAWKPVTVDYHFGFAFSDIPPTEPGASKPSGFTAALHVTRPFSWTHGFAAFSAGPTLGVHGLNLEEPQSAFSPYRSRSASLLGAMVGLTLLIDKHDAVHGPFPIRPPTPVVGSGALLRVGYMHWFSLSDDGLVDIGRMGAPGFYASVRLGLNLL